MLITYKVCAIPLIIFSAAALAQDGGERPDCKYCARQPSMGTFYQCDYPPGSSRVTSYSDCKVGQTYKDKNGYATNNCRGQTECRTPYSHVNGKEYAFISSKRNCGNALMISYRNMQRKLRDAKG